MLAQERYSIYTYHNVSNENWSRDRSGMQWERRSVTSSLKDAKQRARVLYKSNKYQKIEVHQQLRCGARGQSARIVKTYGRMSFIGMHGDFLISAWHGFRNKLLKRR